MRALTTLIGASLLAGAALVSTPALAGGVGLIGGGGMGTTPIYAYEDGNSNPYIINQLRPRTGFGAQVVLGDRDDRFVGVGRFYWQAQLPQTDVGVEDAAAAQGAEGPVQYAINTDTINVGIGTAGIQWGIWGDRTGGLAINALTCIGAGIMTADAREFLVLELGPGVQYSLNKRVQVNAEILYQARYRKGFDHAVTGTVGARYLFD
ncbi:MAG: hypothetical protein ACI9VR_002662 [Cognaticolwellia sp.]|jgi:hypothetical protein